MNKIFKTAAILLAIFAVMFALNHLMPLHRDDYDYSMIWKTGEHIGSLSDVIQSTYLHYFQHGGRLFTVFCLNLFLWLGKFPFDLANSLMFVALMILITVHSRRNLRFWEKPELLASAGILAWLCLPHFAEVAIWKSGSTVYLWSAVSVALFLLPYNLNLRVNPIAIFLLGIIAGCSVENLALTVTLISFALTYKKFELWKLSGAIGNLIGLVILLAAPGNFVRYDAQGTGKGILHHIGNQIAANAEMLLYILPIVLLIICALRILSGVSFKINKTAAIFLPILTAIFIISYFFDSFLTTTLKDFCTSTIFPLFNPSEKFIIRFDNTLSKSEEMIIYLLIILMIYRRIGIGGKLIFKNIFPQINFAVTMFALAIFNNLVMLAAPTFPARASISSVLMIIIGTLSILEQVKFPTTSLHILQIGAGLLSGFTIISALLITSQLRSANDERIAQIKQAKKNSAVRFAPIEIKNRALRHVFF